MALTEPVRFHPYLLLLPAPPSTELSSLKSAYGEALAYVLSFLSRSVRGTSRSVLLDIAISTPDDLGSLRTQPRSRSFARLQRILATIYRLLGVVSASESVELDGPGGVDARVFFLDCNTTGSPGQGVRQLYGPVVGLDEIAASRRSWGTIYCVSTEQGKALFQKFTNAQGERPISDYASDVLELTKVSEPQPSTEAFGEESSTQNRLHHSVAVGGTFDHLHAGHKLLLTATVLPADPLTAQSSSDRTIITVGITGDELLVNKKYAEYLESWEERWQSVWKFLQSIVDFTPPDRQDIKIERVSNPGPNGKCVTVTVAPSLDFRFVQIADPFGPTITDPDISALVVSAETRSGGKAVNDEREKKGWAPLEVFEVDVLELGDETAAKNGASSESFDAKISSTDIRRRRMNLAKKGSL